MTAILLQSATGLRLPGFLYLNITPSVLYISPLSCTGCLQLVSQTWLKHKSFGSSQFLTLPLLTLTQAKTIRRAIQKPVHSSHISSCVDMAYSRLWALILTASKMFSRSSGVPLSSRAPLAHMCFKYSCTTSDRLACLTQLAVKYVAKDWEALFSLV